MVLRGCLLLPPPPSEPLGSGGHFGYCEGLFRPSGCVNVPINFRFVPTAIMWSASFPDWPAMEKKASDFDFYLFFK